jgi:hypothetical protein
MASEAAALAGMMPARGLRQATCECSVSGIEAQVGACADPSRHEQVQSRLAHKGHHSLGVLVACVCCIACVCLCARVCVCKCVCVCV